MRTRKRNFVQHAMMLVLIGGTAVAIAGPTISSVTPMNGPAGTPVIITGANFDPIAANNIVYFGAVQAVVDSATTTFLKVRVPYGATHAPITVTTNGLTAYSTLPFVATFPSRGPISATAFSTKVDFTVASTGRGVTIADFNLDAKPDIALESETQVHVYRNTCTRGSIDASSFAVSADFDAGAFPNCGIASDFNRDGKLDLAVTNWDIGYVTAMKNVSTNATMAFVAGATLQTQWEPLELASSDIDGDGRPDLVITSTAEAPFGGEGSICVLRNTGTGGVISFASGNNFRVGGRAFGLAVGDLDGDGKPDVAVSNVSTSCVAVFRNVSSPGSVAFAQRSNFLLEEFTRGIGMGDLDGDGKLDLVVALQYSGRIALLRNVGTIGSIAFQYPPVRFVAGSMTFYPAITDLDGDAKPDIVVTNRDNSTVSVFRNTSVPGAFTSGSLAQRVDFAVGEYPNWLALGDLDCDGAPDIVTSNYNGRSFSVLRNTLHAPTSVTRDRQPTAFALSQNYPNPFNPSTEVRFSVETTGRATLRVFSVIGEEVATLFDDVALSGQYYRVRFDGGENASGAYLFKLQSGTKHQVRRMMFIK